MPVPSLCKALIDDLAPDLVRDPHWSALATALDRADRAGYYVAARLPELIARRPLPEQHAGRELCYRLGSDCEAAFGPIPSHRPAARRRVAATLTTGTSARLRRAFGAPSITHGGPPR